MSKHDWRRWQGWRGHVTYWKGFAAWQLYRALPVVVLPYWAFGWLLPSVGDYAEWDNAIEIMREDLAN